MDPLAPLIDALHNDGRLRVWSLVITVFGDSVQPRGGVISNIRLQQLLGRVGVERGTLRTALSRLAKDGWLESERNGRASFYRLSKSGMARFADASGRIYAPVRKDPVTQWSLSIGRGLSGIEVAPSVYLSPLGDESEAKPDCRVTGSLDILSAHLRNNLLKEDHSAAVRAVLQDVAVLRGQVFDPLTALAARTLLVHRWRRLVLRYPELPIELLPTNMCKTAPRAQVRDTYRALSQMGEIWLDSGLDSLGPMPPANVKFSARF